MIKLKLNPWWEITLHLLENSSVIKLSLTVTPKNLLEGIKNSYV